MSYRPQGRADISATQPRARGVCDRCGFMTNHYKLKWQYDWRGPKLQNLRLLVCDDCYDKYQQNGQRTIILPADPIPIMNARPEYYVGDNNPLSGLGASPSYDLWELGSQIGNMVNNAGVPAAFNGSVNKPAVQSACIAVSNSSFNNYIGINWQEGTYGLTTPSSLLPPVRTHTVSFFTLTAPNDIGFGSSAYVIQGSPVDPAAWGGWTTIASGNTQGIPGEVISGTTIGGRYQFHRAAFYGNGGGSIQVAQLQMNVSDGSS